jgi:hypothetical protein
MAMEKPTFWASVAPAELIPTTLPDRSNSGPPELPGLIDASVWISPVRCAPVSVSIERSRAETMPSVTVGPPVRSRALPTATTRWPTFSVLESPSGRGHREPFDNRRLSEARPDLAMCCGGAPCVYDSRAVVLQSCRWSEERGPSNWRRTGCAV